jgi:hypothetical protein
MRNYTPEQYIEAGFLEGRGAAEALCGPEFVAKKMTEKYGQHQLVIESPGVYEGSNSVIVESPLTVPDLDEVNAYHASLAAQSVKVAPVPVKVQKTSAPVDDAEGPGYLDYGSGALSKLFERLENLNEDFFLIGEFSVEGFPGIAKHVKSHPLGNHKLMTTARAYNLARQLKTEGINHVVIVYGIVKDEHVMTLLSFVPGLTIHHYQDEEKNSTITKRNVASNGEVLPDDVNLLAEALYEQGGIPTIPVEAMYGKAADLARTLETPLGFAYPAVLTAACGAGIEASGTIRPTLYTSLLGSVGSGKSVTKDRVLELFLPNKGFDDQPGDVRDPRNMPDTAASDQGLYRMLADTAGQPRLITQDEGRNMLNKASIDGSSLAPVLCQLFNMNYAGGADKMKQYSICVKLSMLLCVKIQNPSEFPEVFGFASAHGLYDRSLFGVHHADDYKFTPWKKPEFTFEPTTPSVSPDVFERVNDWGDKTDRRLRELVLRVAYVSCAINGDDHLTDEAITAALAFIEWQKRLRVFYQTAKGSNEHQDCTETILGAFRDAPGKCGKWKKFAVSGNWYRKFPRVLTSVRKMLEAEGVLVYDASTKKYFLNERITP